MGIFPGDGMAIAANGRVLMSGVDEIPAEDPSKLPLEYSDHRSILSIRSNLDVLMNKLMRSVRRKLM